MKCNIFITRQIPKEAIELLQASCQTVEVHRGERLLTKEELIEKVRGRDGSPSAA